MIEIKLLVTYSCIFELIKWIVSVADLHFRYTYILFSLPPVGVKFASRWYGNNLWKLYIGTAENMPSYELIDTTGAGDAFAGAVLYGNVPLFYILLLWTMNGHFFIVYTQCP
jgi:hypothetical protein